MTINTDELLSVRQTIDMRIMRYRDNQAKIGYLKSQIIFNLALFILGGIVMSSIAFLCAFDHHLQRIYYGIDAIIFLTLGILILPLFNKIRKLSNELNDRINLESQYLIFGGLDGKTQSCKKTGC